MLALSVAPSSIETKHGEKLQELKMRQHVTPAFAACVLAVSGQAIAQEAVGQLDLVSMTRAIEAATGRIDGGVLEAELENEDGLLVYEIDLVSGSDVYEVAVDARTGDIVSQTEQRITGFVSGLFQEDEMRAAEAARPTLQQALSDIEQQTGARIEALSLDEEDGRWLYEIEIRDDMGEREVMIDALTGEVVATEE